MKRWQPNKKVIESEGGQEFQILFGRNTKAYVDRLLLMSHMCRKSSCASATTNTTRNAQMMPHTIWKGGNEECK